jgi:ElaB/YqjD/DUF883 family membrane-anchored ribosome-binding protein
MTSSAQLEREAEQTRSQLAQRLDELRERITPGQLVDEAVDYAKDSGGGVFVRNLGRQATANPLPVALIGAGIAWLMLSNGKRQSTTAASINRAAEAAIDGARQSMADVGAQIGEFGQKASAKATEFGQQASVRASNWASDASDRVTDARGPRAGNAISSLSETASSAYETAKSRASETYERVADQAKQASSTTADTVAGLGQRTAAASRDLLQFCKTQPLVIAGLGMALGAILGALIPPTETEDNLMGETSDRLKDQAREVAEDQIERTKSAAKSGFKQAEAEFNVEGPGGNSNVPAETSLVPEAEHAPSDEPAEHQR